MKFLLKIFIMLFLVFSLARETSTQWFTDYQPYYMKPYNIHVVDTSNIWVLGYRSIYHFDTTSVINKTPRMGWGEWGVFNNLSIQTVYTAIAGIDTITAFIGSEYGKVYKTTNRGMNWQQILDAGPGMFVGSIKFSRKNPNTGYIFCSRQGLPSTQIIYKTSNFGNTWSTLNPNLGNYYGYYGACVTDSAHVWYGLIDVTSPFNVRIAFTTNGGINWQVSDREDGRRGCTIITFNTDNLFGISISHLNSTNDIISISTNGGIDWTVNDTLDGQLPISLISIPQSSVWYLAMNGTNVSTYISKTTDNGLNWSKMTFESDPGQISDMDGIRLNDKIYCWATTPLLGIVKLVDTPVVIGINNNGSDIPSNFELRQNFPNPFNPSTIINFSIPKNCSVSIKLYDLQGKEIAVLLDNDYRSAGDYSIAFDGTAYASGVYFYKIEAGPFIQSKKMVLVK